MKTCPRCDTEKESYAFGSNRTTKDGLQGWCKQCRADAKNLKRGERVDVTRTRNGREERFQRGPNHGLSKTPLYRRWKSMRERCGNSNAQNYKYYGGRGITVCEEWQQDFLAFQEWALSNEYHQSSELDRIDNERGYSPENCRWVTKLENLQNRRAYLPSGTEERLVAEAKRRGVSVYVLVREAIEAYLGL